MPKPMHFSASNRVLWNVLLLFSSAALCTAGTGDWFSRAWQADEGLPDNTVTGITQTPDGYLWAGTLGGLVRFDGQTFHEFPAQPLPGVPNRVVRSLLLDQRNRLWLMMDRGTLVCVESERTQIYTTRDGLPDSSPASIVEDGEASVWLTFVGSSRPVCRVKDGQVTRFEKKQVAPSTTGCWLASDSKGEVWFATGGYVGVFRDGGFKTLLALKDQTPLRIAHARDGGVWLCDGRKLSHFREGGKLEKRAQFTQPGVQPHAIYEDRTSAVWVGSSDHGLFRYAPDGPSELETIQTSHPQITCLAEDREGNLWVGTAGGGLNRVRARALELLNAKSGQPFEALCSACEDTARRVWVVTQNGLVLRQENGQWQNVCTQTNWPGGRGSCIAAGLDGAVWMGTHGTGLYRFASNQFQVWRKENGLANNSTRSLLVASNGDVWLGSDSPRRLQRFRNGEFRMFPLGSSARSLRSLAEDRGIWAATAEGQLWHVVGDSISNETTNDLGHEVSIRCLHATPDGALWIGYAGYGLGRLKDGKYSRLTVVDGLKEDYISEIIGDDCGSLWFAGNHGIFRARLADLNEAAEGRDERINANVYGRAEGLPSLQANYDNFPRAFRGSDGRLRIAMRSGLAIVHAGNIREDSEPPPVVLERVAVDGKTVALYDSRFPLNQQETPSAADLKNPDLKLQLPPDYRKIEFQFAALSFAAPDNVHFRYRLENFDDDWVEPTAADRSASYSRLPAGGYRFRVQACNPSGVWSTSIAGVSFSVTPFFWQRWWFQASVLAAFSVWLVAVVRWVSFRRLQLRLKQIEQQAALERERTRIARDIHDDLGDRLTKIGLLSGLALKHGNGANGAEQKESFQEIATTARQATDALDEIVWAINPRNDVLPNVINYVGQFAVEFLRTAGIRCRVDLPEHPPAQPITGEARHNLFLVLKEALNNIVRHSGASEVRLRIVADQGLLRVWIEDNGKGFEPSSGSSGNGVQNMRQRITDVGGRFEIHAEQAKGTSVELELPWAVGRGQARGS